MEGFGFWEKEPHAIAHRIAANISSHIIREKREKVTKLHHHHII